MLYCHKLPKRRRQETRKKKHKKKTQETRNFLQRRFFVYFWGFVSSFLKFKKLFKGTFVFSGERGGSEIYFFKYKRSIKQENFISGNV